MPAANVVRRSATETLKIPALRLLSSSATEVERIFLIIKAQSEY